MKMIHRRAVIAAAALCFAGVTFAQERGSKEEAKAMVEAAYEHIKQVGPEKAYKDFTTDKSAWIKKDLYVMVYDGKAVALAHGGNEKLVGKDLSGLKDGTGAAIVPGMLATAAKGGGWYDYDWPDPISKKLRAKSTFARKPPNGDGFIGVGVYR